MTTARYFVSYAHADRDDVGRFLDLFRPQLATSARYRYERWMDTDILPGEDWDSKIKTALKDCDFGILLVSPNFLSSQYITEVELVALLAKSMVVPVALHPILFDGTMNLKGLGERQMYHDPRGRSFGQCRDKGARRAFALDLHQKVDALMRKAAYAQS